MRPETIAILAIFVSFALAEFFRTNLFHKPRQRRKDGVVETISTTTLVLLTQPFVLLAGGLVAAAIAPDSRDALIGIPVIAQVGLRQDPTVDVIDALADSTVLSGAIGRLYNETDNGFDWFWTLGIGFASPSVDDVSGPTTSAMPHIV